LRAIHRLAAEQTPTKPQRVDLDGHVDWFCRPFAGTPTEKAWLELLGTVERLHEQKPIALLVIDSLANLSPMRSENDAVQMLRPLQPLTRLTERGVGVLIAHHPKKGRTLPGQAARGSGALLGFVDIIIEKHALSRRTDDRRRLLRSFSRHSATPPSLVIEWTADGSDYRSLGASAELDYEHGWPLVHAILDESEKALTRRDILQRWPESALAPAKLTLWKWLRRAVEEGRVLQDGLGTRKDPFRYQLPGMVEKWQQNAIAALMKRLEEGAKGKAPAAHAVPPSAGDDATPAVSMAPPEEAPVSREPVPLAERTLEAPAPAAPAPEPLPSPTPEPVAPLAPEAPVRLPYPYNQMNPADVPEEVWRRARAAQRNG
jgi:hypothetical protein